MKGGGEGGGEGEGEREKNELLRICCELLQLRGEREIA
jgi:hypothetical protein